jgi:hypothetical protein
VKAVNGNAARPDGAGAVVATYNVPSVGKTPLRLDGPTLADIFGRISKWSDRRITSLNPGVNLPNQDIIVVHRSDGSGTTYIFLTTCRGSRVNGRDTGRPHRCSGPPGWRQGNEGVTQLVKQTTRHRVRRADLRHLQQSSIRLAEERGGSVRRADAQECLGGGSGSPARGGHRFPSLHHQRSREGILPRLVLHLATASEADEGQRQGQVTT